MAEVEFFSESFDGLGVVDKHAGVARSWMMECDRR